MKKLCLLLAICTAVCALGGAAAAEDGGSESKSAVLTASDRVVQTVFKSGSGVYDAGYGHICLNVIEKDDSAGEYLQPAFFRYDISDYSEYDIKEAVLVWKSGNHKNFTLFDVPGDDLSLSRAEGSDVPERIPVGGLITARTYNSGGTSPDLSGTYPGIPEGYNLAFDVTSYLKNKIHVGKTSVSVMFYSKWGGSAVLDGRGAQLWLRYDANTKPVIRLKSPETSDLVSGEGIRIAAEVTDADGTVEKVTVTFDGKEYAAARTDDMYTVTVPTANVGDGTHEISVYAADDRGAERTLTKTVYCRSYTAGAAVLTDGDGGELDLKALKAGGKVNAAVDIASLVEKELPVTVTVCLYDRYNIMKTFGIGTAALTAAENTHTLHAAATLPSDTELKSIRICVYVTNGFKSEKLIDTGSKGAGL